METIFFFNQVDPIEKGGNNETGRVATSGSVSSHHNLAYTCRILMSKITSKFQNQLPSSIKYFFLTKTLLHSEGPKLWSFGLSECNRVKNNHVVQNCTCTCFAILQATQNCTCTCFATLQAIYSVSILKNKRAMMVLGRSPEYHWNQII